MLFVTNTSPTFFSPPVSKLCKAKNKVAEGRTSKDAVYTVYVPNYMVKFPVFHVVYYISGKKSLTCPPCAETPTDTHYCEKDCCQTKVSRTEMVQ